MKAQTQGLHTLAFAAALDQLGNDSGGTWLQNSRSLEKEVLSANLHIPLFLMAHAQRGGAVAKLTMDSVSL